MPHGVLEFSIRRIILALFRGGICSILPQLLADLNEISECRT